MGINKRANNINNWIKKHNYRENDEDDDEAPEDANVDYFLKEKKNTVIHPEYLEKSNDPNSNKNQNENIEISENIDDPANRKLPKRLRPILSK